MKKLLTLILLAPAMCWGQKTDSATAVTYDFRIEPYSGAWATPANRQNNFIITPKQDTIPVIMLVCDTTFIPVDFTYKIAEINTIDFKQEFGVTKNRISYLWWQFGHEVRTQKDFIRFFQPIVDGKIYELEETRMIHQSYLDNNKNPLPKSIVVWLTKEIK